MKRCPYCDEEIRENAIKCKHCGSVLTEAGMDTLDGVVTERKRQQFGGDDTLDRAVTLGGMGGGLQYDTLDAAVTQGKEASVLAGQYRIVKKIGEGGMGVVYLAEDTELSNREVAIKVLPPLLSRNIRAVENLRKEALTAIKLNHPNIIRLYGFHSDGDVKFLVMEHINGETLEEKLLRSKFGRLNHKDTIKIAERIGLALDYAHSRKPPVFHRDLKPSNVMLTQDGTVKLLDFGIAREMKDSYTRVTGKETSGTLPYMSPEQLMGDRPTASMDIYSLAAVCYECLSGHTPFYTGDLREQILNKPVESLLLQPEAVKAALGAGLAKKPSERPKTSKQLVERMKGKPGRKSEIAEKKKPLNKSLTLKEALSCAPKTAKGFLRIQEQWWKDWGYFRRETFLVLWRVNNGLRMSSSLMQEELESISEDEDSEQIAAKVFRALHAVQLVTFQEMVSSFSQKLFKAVIVIIQEMPSDLLRRFPQLEPWRRGFVVSDKSRNRFKSQVKGSLLPLEADYNKVCGYYDQLIEFFPRFQKIRARSWWPQFVAGLGLGVLGCLPAVAAAVLWGCWGEKNDEDFIDSYCKSLDDFINSCIDLSARGETAIIEQFPLFETLISEAYNRMRALYVNLASRGTDLEVLEADLTKQEAKRLAVDEDMRQFLTVAMQNLREDTHVPRKSLMNIERSFAELNIRLEE